MTDNHQTIDPPTSLGMLRCTRGDWMRALATIALVCATFAAVASLVLVGYTRAFPAMDFIDDPRGLILRAALFSFLSLGAWAVLWRWRRVPETPNSALNSMPASRRVQAVLLLLVIGVALLLGGRLNDYPWAAPDEVHHLVVARNLAEYGVYATGHPRTGFNYFDSFDSVGPAVLGPIAFAFKLFGTSLTAARGVMVAFFVGLCLATFAFTRGLFGGRAGLIAVGLLLGTYSSIYLGRTLYGEVPAYFFLLLGLLAWRRALGGAFPLRWGLLAGGLVACAVLAKTIIILVAFSFLGAWAYDRLTHQRIGWRTVVYPCIGGAAVLALWSLFQRLHGTGVTESGGVLAIYQHYLLFGLSSVAGAFNHAVLPHPLAHLVWLAVIVASVPVVFAHRHDPPATVLYLYAIFLLYWWFFFTPGHLHRYLWNAYAILAIFASPWLLEAGRIGLRRDSRATHRAVAFAVLGLMAWPGIQWTVFQAREIRCNNEMAPEYALLDGVRSFPSAARIATDVDRVPGLVNFFTNQPAETGPDPLALLDTFDLVITRDTPGLRADLPPGCRVKAAGAFVLLSTLQTTE